MHRTKSVTYHCIRDWNNFKKTFPQIPEYEHSHSKIKSYLNRPGCLRHAIACTCLCTCLNENRNAVDHTPHMAQFLVKNF